MKTIRSLLLSAVMLAAVSALTGCSRDASNPVAPAASEPTAGVSREETPASLWGRFGFGISGVMFVHASPDAPAVDIRLGLLPAARALAFPGNTPYRFTLSGPRLIQVNVAGTRTTVISARPTLQRNTFYTVFAANRVANIEPVVLVDDLTPPAAGNAHVRFVHLSPDAPAVDIAVANGGPVLFPNVSFKGSTAFTPVPGGTYDLEVRVAGTNTVALSLPGVRLDAGKIHTVFAKGLLSGSGAQALGAGLIVNWPRFGWGRFDQPMATVETDLRSGDAN